jgi:putative peptidoglycan lipid II flippase
MVKKVFSMLNTEIRGLHKAAYLLGAAALASQILALVRDRLLAGTFGAGQELDVYFAAFRIPDIVFILAASVVSLSALVPAIAGSMRDEPGRTRALVDSVFTFFAVLVLILSALAFLLMPLIASIIFPGFDSATLQSKFIPLSRLLLLSPILLGISNLFASITQLHSKFVLYAASPVLYNLGIIIGIILIFPWLGFIGLGLGVALGAFAHMAVQLPFILRSGTAPRLVSKLDMKALGSVARVSVPRTAALASQQMTILFLTMLGSAMTAGAISVFTLSYALQSVPLSIIGVSYSVAAFPTLSKLFATGQRSEFMQKISASLRHIIFWSLPFAVLFIVLRAQIVRVIYGAGQFDWTATRLTAASLALFSLSILAQGAILLFVRGYYAAGRTRAPLAINVFGAGLIVSLALALWSYFNAGVSFADLLTTIMRVEDVLGASVLVLPLSFTIGTIATALVLWHKFERDFGKLPEKVGLTLAQASASSLIMGLVAFVLLDVFDDAVDLTSAAGVLAQGVFSALGAIAVGLCLLKLMRSRELSELNAALSSRLWRTKAILPGEEERAGGL